MSNYNIKFCSQLPIGNYLYLPWLRVYKSFLQNVLNTAKISAGSALTFRTVYACRYGQDLLCVYVTIIVTSNSKKKNTKDSLPRVFICDSLSV